MNLLQFHEFDEFDEFDEQPSFETNVANLPRGEVLEPTEIRTIFRRAEEIRRGRTWSGDQV